MRELTCVETGHQVRLDEATGKILGFRLGDDPKRIADAIARSLNEDMDDKTFKAMMAALRGVEPAIVYSAMEEIAGKHIMRWRVEGNHLVSMLVE